MDIGSLLIRLNVDTSGVMTANVAVNQLANTAAVSGAKASASMAMFSKNTINSINMVSQRIRTFGYLSSIVLTAPILAFGKSAITMAKDFEFSMAKIQGLAGIAGDVTKKWTQEILAMSTQTATAPQKLAESLYFVASAGFKTAEALEITKMAAKGAATGMGNSAAIADMLVSSLNAYKTSGMTAAHAMDIFTAAVREGKIEPEAFVHTIGSVLPIASELGVSLDQVTAAMASMSLSGATAANSATYLRNVLQKIADPSAQVEDGLLRMGTSAVDLRRSLSERGLMPTLMKLRDLTAQYGQTMFDIFPNIRALIGALNLTGQNLQFNLKIFDAVKRSTGDFDKAFQVASQTLKFQWDTALSAGRVALIRLGQSIGKEVLPVLQWLVKVLGQVSDRFDSMTYAQQKLRIGVLAVIAALGPLALVVSVTMYAVGGLMTMLNGLKVALLAVRAAAMANPFTALLVVAGALAAVIYKLVKQTDEWKKVQGAVIGEVNKEVFSLTNVFEMLKKTAAGTKERAEWIKIVNDRYGPYLSKLLEEKSSLEDITKAQQEALKGMQAAAAFRATSTRMEEAWGKVSEEFDNQMKKFTRAYSAAAGVDAMIPFVAAIYEGIDKTIKENGENLKKGILQSNAEADAVYNKFLKSVAAQSGNLTMNISEFRKAFINVAKFKREQDAIVAGLQGMATQYGYVAKAAEVLAEVEKSRYETVGDSAVKKILQDMELEERGLMNLIRASKAYGFATDANDTLLKLYNDTLEDLGKIGVARAGNAIEHIQNKLKAASSNAGLATISVKSLKEIMDNFNAQKSYFVYMVSNAERLGVKFNYVKEVGNLLVDTLERLAKEGGVGTAEFERLSKEFENLPPDIFEASQALKDFQDQLEFNQMKAEYKLPGFVLPEENMRAVEATINKLLEVRVTVKNLEKTFLSLGAILGAPFDQTIPVAEILDKQIADLIIQYNKFSDAATDAAIQQSIDMLSKEAKAFGGIEVELGLVAERIRRLKRELASIAAPGEEGIESDKFKAKAEEYLNLMKTQTELQGVMSVRSAQAMYESFGGISNQLEVVSAQVDAAKAKFLMFNALMAAGVPGAGVGMAKASEELRNFLIEAEKLQRVQQIYNQLGSAIADISGLIGQAFGGSEDAMTKIVDVVLSTAQSIISIFLAEAAAAILAGETIKGMGLPGLIVGMIGVGVLTAAWEGYKSDMEAAALAKGGLIPQGYPNDSFPAMLTSGELVIPKDIVEKIPKLAGGGIIPNGYPNDSFAAFLSSGESVLPVGGTDELSKKIGVLIKVIDTRLIDAITGLPVPDTRRLGGEFETAWVKEVVTKSLEKGIDPYTSLAIAHQETGGQASEAENPFRVIFKTLEEKAVFAQDEIGNSLNVLNSKLELAKNLGKDTYAEMVQVYNGTGRITSEQFGSTKAYGLEIPMEGISMKENPLYGKRIEDIRNNILMQNKDLVGYIDMLSQGYASPSLPYGTEKKEEPIEKVSGIEGDLTPIIGNVLTSDLSGEGLASSLSGMFSGILTTGLTAVFGPAGGFISKILSSIFGSIKGAKGGIVPPGFPNDTYPALLSSDEIILPFKKYKEYLDMPLESMTKNGLLPSASPNDELQLLMATYEMDFPEEKFKSLFAPMLKRPQIMADQSKRQKSLSKVVNYNNITSNITKLSKQRVEKEGATVLKYLSKFSKEIAVSKSLKNIGNKESLNYTAKIAQLINKRSVGTKLQSQPTAIQKITAPKVLDSIDRTTTIEIVGESRVKNKDIVIALRRSSKTN